MDKNESAADRLKLLRTAASITQKKLSQVLSCSQAKVSDYESGKLQISISDMEIIAKSFNANLHWLLTGTGNMYINKVPARAQGSDSLLVPVYADIAAGIGIEAEDLEPKEHISVPKAIVPTPCKLYCFKISGVSMEPELHSGDYAIISAWQYDVDYDGAICAFRSVDGLLIKRLIYDTKGKRCLLVPLNPTHTIMQYSEDSPDLQIIGRLEAIFRKYT